MRIFYSVKYHADCQNRPEIEMVLGLLESLGYETFCVMRDVENWGRDALDDRALMRVTFEAIRSSDLILVDLSEKGVGLGIEAGYAYANGIRVAVMAPEGQEISTTLRGIAESTCIYRNEIELQVFLSGLQGKQRL